MNKHRGERLTDRIAGVQAGPLPALHPLTIGLRRDLGAATLKSIKQSMYGRAGFYLLHQRILLDA